MRKTIFTFFLVLAASAGTLFAASGTCGDNLTWDLTDGVLTISGTGDMTNWSSSSNVPWSSYRSKITSVIIGNSVTSIGEFAFDYCTGLTSVTIPNSVTSIGKDAFSGCSGLTSITIPNCVTCIGEGAFSGCNRLKSIEIPNSVTSIGSYAFYYCYGLTSVTIGNSVTRIEVGAFSHCTGLTSVTIGNSVTSIGIYAFSSCTGLTSVTIPNSVISIGGSAFAGCTGLTSVIIPNSVTSIGDYAFSGCSGLTNVTIGNSVTSIEHAAFADCSGLTNVTIPNSVTSIGDNAFRGCTGLANVVWNAKNGASPSSYSDAPFYDIRAQITSFTFGNDVETIPAYLCCDMSNLSSITIPNSVISIGRSAFSGCSGLTSIEIPNSVTSIGDWAFGDCRALSSVTLNSNDIVGITYEYDSSIKSIFGNQVTEYIIGNDVTSIGIHAFSSCSGLTSIKIPNSITSIGYGAFAECSGLTSVTIPNSVTSIEGWVFENCSSLTSIEIPNSVKYIEEKAFSGCSKLTSITIPNSVTSIGNSAFSGCTGLTSVVWNAKNCTTRGDFGSQVESFVFGNEVESIPANCCSGMSKLTSITLPNSVTSIGENAFNGCTGLTEPVYNNYLFALMPKTSDGEYTVKDGIQVICSEAFGGCSELTKIKLPSSLKIINGEAFSSCSKLTSLDIPEGVTSLGSMIVNGCFSLQTIKIPKTVNTFLSNTYSSNGYGSVFPFLGINIGKNGFWEEGAFTAFIVDSENPIFASKDGVLYDKNMTKLLQFPCAKKDAYTIPSTVMYIDDYAFYGNQVLTEINLPRNIRIIGGVAFAMMENLTTVHLSEELIKIESGAFYVCYNIKELTFGSKIKSIGESAFTLDINKCKSITCFAEQVPTLEKNAIRVGKITGTIGDRKWENMPSSALTVYVPQASIGDYVVDENWSQFTILPISAEPVSVDEIIVTPSETTAEVVWPVVSGAATYELVIKDKAGNVICTLVFNAQGQLTTIAFNAPARNNATQQTQSTGFSFTVTGLESGTRYDLTMTAKDGNGTTLQENTMSFNTTGEQGVENVLNDNSGNTKFIRDGVLYIEHDGEIYNVQGARVE